MLKNKETGDVFFVVVFTLVLKEDLEKEEAEQTSTDHAKVQSKGGPKEEIGKPSATSVEDLD